MGRNGSLVMPISIDSQLTPYVAALAATLLFLALLWIRAKRAANLAAKKTARPIIKARKRSRDSE
jgi:hypothetical protein